eukprot:Opistho-2@40152
MMEMLSGLKSSKHRGALKKVRDGIRNNISVYSAFFMGMLPVLQQAHLLDNDNGFLLLTDGDAFRGVFEYVGHKYMSMRCAWVTEVERRNQRTQPIKAMTLRPTLR